jgi:hypothetical protein
LTGETGHGENMTQPSTTWNQADCGLFASYKLEIWSLVVTLEGSYLSFALETQVERKEGLKLL